MRILRLGAIIAVKLTTTVIRAQHSVRSEMSTLSSSDLTYIDYEQAKSIDDYLMSTPGFSIDQLMELAGLSVAESAQSFYNEIYSSNNGELSTSCANNSKKNILVMCGPGNNGGDGLVAARHLFHFGFHPTVLYPKQSKGLLFDNLVHQVKDLGIEIITDVSSISLPHICASYSLVVDALFGFSFKGPVRPPFTELIGTLASLTAAPMNTCSATSSASTSSLSSSPTVPVLSVDVPSGWHISEGDVEHTSFLPHAVVSLTAPKLCMKGYQGVHYLGGRFVSPRTAAMFQLRLPSFGSSSTQIIRLNDLLDQDSGNIRLDKDVDDETTSLSVLFATASSLEESKKIARVLLEAQLAACVNIVPTIVSMYVWEGKLEESGEAMLIIKTQSKLIDQVVSAVKGAHSYVVPETIAMGIMGGNKDYLKWVQDSTTTARPHGEISR